MLTVRFILLIRVVNTAFTLLKRPVGYDELLRFVSSNESVWDIGTEAKS